MKRFKFRLQKVLDYRQEIKKEERLSLARRNSELREQETRLQEIVDAISNLGDVESAVYSMAELALMTEYSKRLGSLLEEQEQKVLEAQSAVESARQSYVASAVEAQVLHTLKDRKHEQHKEQARHEQRKALNDIAVKRHGKDYL